MRHGYYDVDIFDPEGSNPFHEERELEHRREAVKEEVMSSITASTWRENTDPMSDGSSVYSVVLYNADGQPICEIDCVDEDEMSELLQTLNRVAA